jgi:hypothetical protein
MPTTEAEAQIRTIARMFFDGRTDGRRALKGNDAMAPPDVGQS